MYILGHASLGYLLNRGILGTRKFSIPLIFAASMLPDLDYILPIEHHYITHSLFFWLVLYAPLFVLIRQRAIPYFIATLSHFLIADVLAGGPPILLGITDMRFSMPILSDRVAESVMEVTLFGVYALIAVTKEKFNLYAKHPKRDLVVFFGVVTFVVVGRILNPQPIVDKPSFEFLVSSAILGAGHVALVYMLIRGFFASKKKSPLETKSG